MNRTRTRPSSSAQRNQPGSKAHFARHFNGAVTQWPFDSLALDHNYPRHTPLLHCDSSVQIIGRPSLTDTSSTKQHTFLSVVCRLWKKHSIVFEADYIAPRKFRKLIVFGENLAHEAATLIIVFATTNIQSSQNTRSFYSTSKYLVRKDVHKVPDSFLEVQLELSQGITIGPPPDQNQLHQSQAVHKTLWGRRGAFARAEFLYVVSSD